MSSPTVNSLEDQSPLTVSQASHAEQEGKVDRNLRLEFTATMASDQQSQRVHPGIWALSTTAFAIGVTEFIVVGILPAISRDLHVSLSRTGGLVGLYALALAIGTPITVLAVARFPRKPVMLSVIAIFILGNLLAATARDFHALLIGRIITAVAHGSFFAIGATVATRLAARGQGSKAIAAMFAGLNLAMVLGVPLGSYLGNALGWRMPFYAVSVLAVLALVATILLLPSIDTRTNSHWTTQLRAITHPAILAMMLITILSFGSSFAAFTFITPILTDITGYSKNMASALLVVFGAATLFGNFTGGKIASDIGWQKTLRGFVLALIVTLSVLALVLHDKIPMVVLLFIWGALCFGITPAVQAGMITTAEIFAPESIDFASALNISSFNFGITLGEMTGSAFVAHGKLGLTPWAGAVTALLALAPLAWLARHEQAHHNKGLATPGIPAASE